MVSERMKKTMFKDAVKTALVATGAVTGSLALAPHEAAAVGWSPDEMMTSAGKTGNLNVTTVNASTVDQWVTGITNWLIGIAVVIFVLRVVLTAVDRMVLGNTMDGMGGRPGPGGPGGTGGPGGPQGQGFRLSDIPVVGAYPPNVTWKQVWINFAKNLALVVGAYVIVQLIMGVVLWLIGVGTSSGTQG